MQTTSANQFSWFWNILSKHLCVLIIFFFYPYQTESKYKKEIAEMEEGADVELRLSEEEEDRLGQKDVECANLENSGDEDGEQLGSADTGEKTKSKKCVPGIVYLGHIPPRLRPKHVRNLLSVYGEIGRIFLQSEGEIIEDD